MDRREIINTRYGEMLDMIACLSIFNGGAEQKNVGKKLTYDEVMELR